VSRPIDVVVLNCCVTETKDTSFASKISTILAKSASERDVALDQQCAAYCERIMEMPEMVEWVEAARLEPDEIEEFEAEF
jgi:hypothetical protein